ncbi:MAG: thiamine pyrophosphate-binding protein [Nitriliruptorales bacterium]|nr:thiamine pyrophosphate-binding protein [Nitriliruptorales bacterium]
MENPSTGADAVVEALRAEGVNTIFGLVGSSTMDLFDKLYDADDIRFVGARDERTGTNMADGYARVSGALGVMIAGQSGPGVTNAVTGVAQAQLAFSPVLVIAGGIMRKHVYADGFQEIDQQRLLEPITKRTYTVPNAGRLIPVLQEAMRHALTGRKGPVVVNVPRDVFAEATDMAGLAAPDAYRLASRPAPDPEALRRAARLLAGAERPVIVAGGGVKDGGRWQETATLAELLGCPVVMSAGHGDAIPSDHPLTGGQFGPRGNPVATAAVQRADVILVLGSRLGFNTTFLSSESVNPDADLIQVDVHTPAIGRYFPVSVGLVGDAPLTAASLSDLLAGHQPGEPVVKWARQFKEDRDRFRFERDETANDSGSPIAPARAFRALRRTLPRDAVVTLDAGTLNRQATDALEYFMPPGLITPLDWGCVGFSFGAGLGAQVAAPDRPVVSLAGDGGFAMTVAELSTAVSEDIPIKVVVLNNHCWGAEKAYQQDFFGGRYIGSDLDNPPFDEVAKLYGAAGYRADDPDTVEDVLRQAFAEDRPTVVDMQISPDALSAFDRGSFSHRT